MRKKAPAKPGAARPASPTPTINPNSPRAPAPAAGPAAKPAAPIIGSAKELAAYMATVGFAAEHFTDGRPQLRILADGVRWHDPDATAQRAAEIIAAELSAGRKPDPFALAGAAVPATHVALAARLMWPWLEKSGFLSADALPDEGKLAAGVLILAAPIVPALWKFATYRPPEQATAAEKKPDPPTPPRPAAPALRLAVVA